MLRIWFKQARLFSPAFSLFGAIIAGTAIGDVATEGAAQPGLEVGSFTAGVAFAIVALSEDSRRSTRYFAALPWDPGRSRRCVIDAAVFWLALLLLTVLAFQYLGPAKWLATEYLRRLHPDGGFGPIGSPIPRLDRLALPLLGFWLTTSVLLDVGWLTGAPKRLVDAAVLAPVVVLILVVAFVRPAFIDSLYGGHSLLRYIGSGCVELAVALALARRCRQRIVRMGTELQVKGVLG